MEMDAVGFRSPWAFLSYFLFFVAPLAYIYIGLMLLRDLCEYFPETVQRPLHHYVPFLANLATLLKSYYGFRLVDVWCVIEALFYIACKLKIRYLQAKDPLEASLSAAPMLDSEERKVLWDHMMEFDSDLGWISEWFLDRPHIETISRYDIFDFICWAMFDGRNQEHLTTQELQDLESFVEDLEYRISMYLYGEETASSSNLILEEDSDRGGDDSNRGTCEDDDMDPMVVQQRDRLNSDMAVTALSNNNLASIAERDEESQEFTTPVRIARQVSNDESSAAESGSGGDWTSLSTRRPRPKKGTYDAKVYHLFHEQFVCWLGFLIFIFLCSIPVSRGCTAGRAKLFFQSLRSVQNSIRSLQIDGRKFRLPSCSGHSKPRSRDGTASSQNCAVCGRDSNEVGPKYVRNYCAARLADGQTVISSKSCDFGAIVGSLEQCQRNERTTRNSEFLVRTTEKSHAAATRASSHVDEDERNVLCRELKADGSSHAKNHRMLRGLGAHRIEGKGCFFECYWKIDRQFSLQPSRTETVCQVFL